MQNGKKGGISVLTLFEPKQELKSTFTEPGKGKLGPHIAHGG